MAGDGFAQLRNVLGRVGRFCDGREALSALGPLLVAETEGHFERGSSPWGVPWKPNAASTLLQRRKGHGRIGVNSARLLRSIASQARGDTELHWGTNVVYGRWLHEGTRPHEIKAKQGRALAWRVAPGGRGAGGRFLKAMIFRRSVHHPGTAARPFLGVGPHEQARIKEVFGERFRTLFGSRWGQVGGIGGNA